jgi:L-rhamnose mutarotase
MGIHEGYRTRLRPGAADEYVREHARIPDATAEALRASGLLSWRIWLDGNTLFHAIETVGGRAAMSAEMSARDPLDQEWHARISALVDDDPDSRRTLAPVWTMVGDDQEPLSIHLVPNAQTGDLS